MTDIFKCKIKPNNKHKPYNRRHDKVKRGTSGREFPSITVYTTYRAPQFNKPMENRSKPLKEERCCAKVQSKGFCEKFVSQEKKQTSLQISNEQSSVVVIKEMIQKELQKFYYVKKKKFTTTSKSKKYTVSCRVSPGKQ